MYGLYTYSFCASAISRVPNLTWKSLISKRGPISLRPISCKERATWIRHAHTSDRHSYSNHFKNLSWCAAGQEAHPGHQLDMQQTDLRSRGSVTDPSLLQRFDQGSETCSYVGQIFHRLRLLMRGRANQPTSNNRASSGLRRWAIYLSSINGATVA